MWLDIAAAMQHMLPHAPPQSTHDTVCTYNWEDTYKTLVGVMHTFGCLLCLEALPNTVMTGLSLSRAKGWTRGCLLPASPRGDLPAATGRPQGRTAGQGSTPECLGILKVQPCPLRDDPVLGSQAKTVSQLCTCCTHFPMLLQH